MDQRPPNDCYKPQRYERRRIETRDRNSSIPQE